MCAQGRCQIRRQCSGPETPLCQAPILILLVLLLIFLILQLLWPRNRAHSNERWVSVSEETLGSGHQGSLRHQCEEITAIHPVCRREKSDPEAGELLAHSCTQAVLPGNKFFSLTSWNIQGGITSKIPPRIGHAKKAEQAKLACIRNMTDRNDVVFIQEAKCELKDIAEFQRLYNRHHVFFSSNGRAGGVITFIKKECFQFPIHNPTDC